MAESRTSRASSPPIASEWLGECPLPTSRYDQIVLGHGSGGRPTADLVRQLFLPALGKGVLAELEDPATLDLPHDARPGARLAFTTHAFVAPPIFFPGGDV